MAMPPPIRFGRPVEMHVRVVDIVDVEADVTYQKYSMTVWVQVNANDMVPHRYVTWFVLMDGDEVGPIEGYNGPSRAGVEEP